MSVKIKHFLGIQPCVLLHWQKNFSKTHHDLLSNNYGLTRAWFVPLSLVCRWFEPLPVCDHFQGIGFPPNRRWSIVFRIIFRQTNKQTNEPPVLGTPPIIERWINLEVRGEDLYGKKKVFAPPLCISRTWKPPTISWPLKQLNPSKLLVREFKPGWKWPLPAWFSGETGFIGFLGPSLWIMANWLWKLGKLSDEGRWGAEDNDLPEENDSSQSNWK